MNIIPSLHGSLFPMTRARRFMIACLPFLLAASAGPVSADVEAFYFTDIAGIKRADSDGGNAEYIKQRVHFEDLALDLSNGHVYFIDSGHPGGLRLDTGRLLRANLDGTNVVEILTNLTEPDGIALDAVANHIYAGLE